MRNTSILTLCRTLGRSTTSSIPSIPSRYFHNSRSSSFRSSGYYAMTFSNDNDDAVVADNDEDEELRTCPINMFNIPLIPTAYTRKLFGERIHTIPSPKLKKAYAYSLQELTSHGLIKPDDTTSAIESRTPTFPYVELPELGGDVSVFFDRIGRDMAEPYLSYAVALSAKGNLPKKPERWELRAGWTRYTNNGNTVESVDHPIEDGVVFDVETSVMTDGGRLPVLAVGVSREAWYLWVADALCNSSIKDGEELEETFKRNRQLIPFGGHEGNTRLIVGHNVGYDRARIADEYHLERTSTRFLDSMSMHIAVSGYTTTQRNQSAPMRKARKLREEESHAPSESDDNITNNSLDLSMYDGDTDVPEWAAVGSLNSLSEVYTHYTKRKLDKSKRDMFVKDNLETIRSQLEVGIDYCASDVHATFDVFQVLLPRFLEKCPHPVTFAGTLEMGTVYLPVNKRWKEYIDNSEKAFTEREQESEMLLQNLVEKMRQKKDSQEDWNNDDWLYHLDWSVKKVKLTKPKLAKDGSVKVGGESRPVKGQRFIGEPKWWIDLVPSGGSSPRITPTMRIAPYALRLQWNGFPVRHIVDEGWCYRVPVGDDASQTKRSKVVVIENEPDYVFVRIPHPGGPDQRVGSLFSRSFQADLESGILSSPYPEAKRILDKHVECSYWRSNRERVNSQFVYWKDDDGNGDNDLGAILPPVITSGTITRRAVERTWLTASNAKKNRIGSEIKSTVVAPPGYKIVGADVDSQELWIAAVLGDMDRAAVHGSTPFGWMTLRGSKNEGTDMHSVTANIMGISRDHAKIFNYGRIYGAGQSFAVTLLLQFNKALEPADAESKARELYLRTKGSRTYHLTRAAMRYLPDCDDPWVSLSTAKEVQAKFKLVDHTIKWKDIVDGKKWRGGTESDMFNKLEHIAQSNLPRTPVLDCAICDPLMPTNAGKKFMTSRINWVVQSSAVDYLHLMITSMRYLMDTHGIRGRFAVSIHDEVRYIIAEEDSNRAAQALHITNMLVRAMFALRLGFTNLPASVAFFSSVDVDSVLRKEVFLDCVTPSNPDPIPSGEMLTILKTIDVTKGKLD